MKRITMPNAHLDAPSVVLGCLRIADLTDDEIRTLVSTARDAGIDYFDHSDIYGDRFHHCEERFGTALQLSSAEREEITIQTKVGIVRDAEYYDHSYDYIVSHVEDSLRALRTDYVDVLLLHRPDALSEPEEVARAFNELHSSGKVRHFGVSNHTPGQIELLKTAVEQPIVANQMQMSITHSPMITHGIAANIMGEDQSAVRDGGGLLDYCRLNGITVQAWSPFQGGTAPTVLFDRDEYPELNEVLDRLSKEFDVPPEAIATAWLTRHPADIQVIIGTTTPSRVQAAAAGSDIPLTRPEWYALLKAAGWQVP